MIVDGESVVVMSGHHLRTLSATQHVQLGWRSWTATASRPSPTATAAFHNPLDPARVAEALDTLRLGPADRVLDAGCGAGELLVDLAERHGCGGLGVDTSEILIAEARRRAAQRVPCADLEFVAGPAEEIAPGGTYAAACCLGSLHALGGLQRGLGGCGTPSRRAEPS